jgi:UDP-N-acetylmuramyl-tripeptide synthetase|tara:strand:+ start:1439 stop:2836 length:1398 start_codon:yes stop_codon:yes gene_type:complete
VNNNLPFEHYIELNIDYSKVVNSTLDIEKDSILCIQLDNVEKLDNLILEGLNKGTKLVLTSSNSTIENENVYRYKNYEKVFYDILKKICPDYKTKNYFGITGTNGKTTTGYLLKQLIGSTSAFVGTVDEENYFNFTKEEHLTTPKLFNLVKLISNLNSDIDSIILEVSSHAIKQERLKDINFIISGFTNLSQDHLDYHTNMDEYLMTKSELFNREISNKFLFVDTEYGQQINLRQNYRGISIGNSSSNDIEFLSYQNEIISFKIDGIKIQENLLITGPESVYNFLLAFGLAYYSQLYDFEILKNNIKTLKNPPGRYQVLDTNENSIIVDYSHTPDAIEKVIRYTRDLYQNEIIVLFGAGGNRDKSKRSLMGQASQLANKIIITNDNPRSENPMEIAKDILAGIDLQKDAKIILDRRDALEEAISFLNEKTTLLVLGKGHEKNQEIGDRILDFDDVVVIKDILGNK